MSVWKLRGAQGSLQSTGAVTIGSINSVASQSSQVINLSQSSANLNGLFNLRSEDSAYVKKYEVFEITEDLLVLSVVWQRLRQQRHTDNEFLLMPSSITDSVLFNNIKPEDRTKTEIIRDYYHKKLMMWALNDIQLTPFRQDMRKFIQSDGKMFAENMKPLVYRLPEFYDYDSSFDELFLTHNAKVNQQYTSVSKEKRLVLANTLIRKRKHMSVKEYWFADENDNLNLMTVDTHNPLLKLLDLHTQNPCKVSGFFSKKTRDNREYCVIDKYSFS